MEILLSPSHLKPMGLATATRDLSGIASTLARQELAGLKRVDILDVDVVTLFQ